MEEKYLEKLIKIQEQYIADKEVRHGFEDDILCDFLEELGYTRLVKQYKKTVKWYA